jgi:hypothetical protein
MHQERAHFPFLATNIGDEDTGQNPDWVTASVVFTVNGVKVGSSAPRWLSSRVRLAGQCSTSQANPRPGKDARPFRTSSGPSLDNTVSSRPSARNGSVSID